MRKLLFIAILISAAALLLVAQPKAQPMGQRAVVVELFTSQGCSSCPPADDLLSEIARDPALRGRVIPLAFHVDYWDRLGWRDPFSSRQWTARQAAYVHAMNLASAYTPQVVVDGERQMVGSERGALIKAIHEQSARQAPATLKLTIAGDVAHVTAETDRPLELIVLTVADAASTSVPRGENQGRTLTNARVVRDVVRAGSVARGSSQRDVRLPRTGTDAVALLQDPVSLKIYAAATVAAAASRP